ncbi:toll/interleukin-1 receptor domain-containing protein [Frankia gtarii]|uniref:toll/interleukin-1 receptor domain-containing protein n=1 Tax=Frankia gtarii TaxID=2950102 RepID=UPI0021C00D01|nr:toll/interleukin-1 receptor domain-containing protein [Frankia gtarii]
MSGADDGATESDFLISYIKADQDWAEWIAWNLEGAGYKVQIEAWDAVPGSNWVFMMNQAVTRAKRTIAVLSHAYLSSTRDGQEWQAAYNDDPTGITRKLVPIRVEDCKPDGVLSPLITVDLFDLALDTAQQRLLAAIRAAEAGRMRPTTEPVYPPARSASPARSPSLSAVAVTGTSGAPAPDKIEASGQVTDQHTAPPLLDKPGSLVPDVEDRPTTDGRWLTFRSVASVAPVLGGIVAAGALAGGAATSSRWWAARPGEVLGPVGIGTAMTMLAFAILPAPRRLVRRMALSAVAGAGVLVVATRPFGLSAGALRTGIEAVLALGISLVISYISRRGARPCRLRRRLRRGMDGQPSRQN